MNRLLTYLINFLPIFIIFLLVFYTNTFAIISNTILGKLFAVLLILFYVKHDKYTIHNEMSEHIFPEIKHNDEHHKCNLCDNTCDFSFVEKKINMEDLLVKPKSSNDWVVYVWENMMNLTE